MNKEMWGYYVVEDREHIYNAIEDQGEACLTAKEAEDLVIEPDKKHYIIKVELVSEL